jgi:hypothetical protein
MRLSLGERRTRDRGRFSVTGNPGRDDKRGGLALPRREVAEQKAWIVCPCEQFDSRILGCYGKMTGLHSGRERLQAMPILTLAYGIPLWFLVLSLFLPRLSLFVGWIHMWWFFVPQPWAAVLWAFLPRVLVLIFIHAHQGFDLWFWIHLVTAIVVWLASGASHKRRRVRRRVAR